MKILKFSADWCGPCKMLQKTLDDMVLPYPVESVDIDKQPELAGEFGIRGSILDLFPVGSSKAFRIDFIGDEIDSMKVMDPLTQRSSDLINNIDVYPSNEYLLNEKNIKNFRQKFRLASGSDSLKSHTYEKVSSGVKFQGIEHFLPLIHQSPLSSIFDYFYSDPKSVIVLSKNFLSLINKRHEEILNFVDERKIEKSDNSVVKVDDLYLSKQELDEKLALFKKIELNEFDYLDNKTMSEITNIVHEKIVEAEIPKENHKETYKKLAGYRYVDEIYELHKGKMVRWIRLGTNKLTNGGIVTDIKFLENGVHILCMNSQRRFIQYKFDDCYTFQKMNTEEQLILMAYEQLS